MRFVAGMVALAVCIGCSASAPRPAANVPGPVAPGGQPTWVPAYSPDQLALLRPANRPIQAPALRVFPDLARFWYANNRPLGSPEEALRFTRLVATVLNDSPRFYVIDETRAELANTVVQYGPPPAPPSGWHVARRGADGVGELVSAPLGPAARVDYAGGLARDKAGDLPSALAAYRAAAAKSAGVPALKMAVGGALMRSGKVAEAEVAYKEALAADATFAPAAIALAEIAEKRGDVSAARKLVTEALAYQPDSRRALEMAARLGAGTVRVPPFSIFLDVDAAGAIHAAAAGGGPAQMYAGCRAVMRYEPEVRAQIFEQAANVPYYLSVVEEVICIEAALGAYMVDRSEDGSEKADANLDALLEMAREEGLSGYVMFEILGQYRPERARSAPPDVHRAMVAYVERHVLGQKDLPAGVYTARRHDEPARGASMREARLR